MLYFYSPLLLCHLLRFYFKVDLFMCVIFLFCSVIILFVYACDRYGTAATSGEDFFMTTTYGFQSLPFAIGGFVWDVLAVPDPSLLLCFLL